jgi:DNA-binding XRE family transcriptional regulator
MNAAKRKKLEAKGWKIGSAQELLDLTDHEAIYIELKLTLGENLKKLRLEKKMTQNDLAKLIKSNQSRVAKMEAGDISVSIDLLVKSLLSLGTSRKVLASIINQS